FVARTDLFKCTDKFILVGVLKQISVGTRVKRLQHVLFRVVHGKDNSLRIWGDFRQFGGSFQACHTRHADVEYQDIGMELACHFEGLSATSGLAHDPDVGIGLKHGFYAIANQHMIIGQYDIDGTVHCYASTAAEFRRGRVSRTVVPSPGCDLISRLPLIYSVLSYILKNPRPESILTSRASTIFSSNPRPLSLTVMTRSFSSCFKSTSIFGAPEYFMALLIAS